VLQSSHSSPILSLRMIEGLLPVRGCCKDTGCCSVMRVPVLVCPSSGAGYMIKILLRASADKACLYIASRVLATGKRGEQLLPVAGPDLIIKAMRRPPAGEGHEGGVRKNVEDPLQEVAVMQRLSVGGHKPSHVVRLLDCLQDEAGICRRRIVPALGPCGSAVMVRIIVASACAWSPSPRRVYLYDRLGSRVRLL
jgi:hypothetical protein